jgi:hypothetical protein
MKKPSKMPQCPKHPDPKHARPIAGYQIVTSTTSEAVQPGAQFGWNAECPSPKVVLGGGYFAVMPSIQNPNCS